MASLIKTKTFIPRDKRGFTLVEVIIAISVLLVVTIGGLSAHNLTTNTISINRIRNQANLLAQQGMEALLAIRAANFPSLTVGDFHPVLSSNEWGLATGPESIGNFTRTITLESIMRNLACTSMICDIATVGGIIDPNSLNATVKINWKEGSLDKEYRLNTLVTYWR